MTDRNALLEIALDAIPDGLAVFDNGGCVVFWNPAAEAITGHAYNDFEIGPMPIGLNQLLHETARMRGPQLVTDFPLNRGMQINIHHKLGHEVSVITRSLKLRDSLGEAIGAAVLFHPAERLDALPHGETGGDQSIPTSQIEFEERLCAEFENFQSGGQPFGVLWIGVDQGQNLRKTHGAAACHAMLEKIQRAVTSGLRPAEELGRWGEDEFLVLAHERTPEMLARHAGMLAGLARTADFRWWGDRVSLTVSVGAAQADRQQPLNDLLDRAQIAMEKSIREGGNRVTCVPHENKAERAAGEVLICTPS